jgi:hypothetical protein
MHFISDQNQKQKKFLDVIKNIEICNENADF